MAGTLTAGLSLAAIPLAARAQPPAGARCTHPMAGAVAEEPPDLFSAGGALDVTMDYLTSLDADGRTLFCFRDTAGSQNPTLHVRPGDTLNFTVNNKLPVLAAGSPVEVMAGRSRVCGSATMTDTSMNVHFHGTNTSPRCGADEVVHTLVNAGASFTYHVKIPADEPAGLYWYHPHVHGFAEAAVQGGASGLLVVDGIERVQREVAGLPERLLIVRDQVVMAEHPPGGTVPAWDLSLDGVPIAYPALTPALIRMSGRRREFWRVANASADTVLDLELLYDGVVQPLEMVALDSVAIGSQDENRHGHSASMRHILLPTAGRAEFIVPAPPVGTRVAILRTVKVDTGPFGDNDPTRTLARLSVGDAEAAPLRLIAASAEPAGPQRFQGVGPASVTARRTMYFSELPSDPNNPASPTNFYITVDGAKPVVFDAANPPAIVTRKGAVEDWTVQNRSGEVHEFHIHQIHFQVLEQDGDVEPRAERQFRDTIQVPYWTGSGPFPSVHLRLDFRGFVVGDYVYHCHILGHEDNGMMAVIRVLPAL